MKLLRINYQTAICKLGGKHQKSLLGGKHQKSLLGGKHQKSLFQGLGHKLQQEKGILRVVRIEGSNEATQY